MRIAYVDAVGGAAGDMLLAALLDAGAERDTVTEAVSCVLGQPVEIATRQVRRGGLRALAFEPPAIAATRHRTPAELRAALELAPLQPALRTRSVAVLERLVQAEGHVHGVGLEDLELRELGEDDTLVDIVGVVSALHSLGVDRLVVASLPMPPPSGAGEHGAPAPVTVELLRGFAVRSSAAGSELPETVTPTAAAIFAALGEPSSEGPELTLHAVGVGAGTRDPASVANVVRVLVGEAAGPPSARRLLAVETNVDDMIPELVPDAIEALLASGALDAWAMPIVMKAGRPALQISALCEPAALADVRRAFFEATTTLGVRIHEVDRPEMERRIVEVALGDGGPLIRIKIGSSEGRALTAKPEHADVVEAAAKLGRSVRSVHAEATSLAYRVLEREADE